MNPRASADHSTEAPVQPLAPAGVARLPIDRRAHI